MCCVFKRSSPIQFNEFQNRQPHQESLSKAWVLAHVSAQVFVEHLPIFPSSLSSQLSASCLLNMISAGITFPSSAGGTENIAAIRGGKRTRRNALMNGKSAS